MARRYRWVCEGAWLGKECGAKSTNAFETKQEAATAASRHKCRAPGYNIRIVDLHRFKKQR